jgi:hypothetical protein
VYSCVDIILLTELSNMVLVVTNIMENITKIAMFNHVGDLTPLYEEKSTIVESDIITVMKIKMNISEFSLPRVNVA